MSVKSFEKKKKLADFKILKGLHHHSIQFDLMYNVVFPCSNRP